MSCHRGVGFIRRGWRGSERGEMDIAIAKANIEHFKKLLETETDEKKRGVLERLLAVEELKLAAALKGRHERKKD